MNSIKIQLHAKRHAIKVENSSAPATDKFSTVRVESNESPDFTAFLKFLRGPAVCSCNPSGLLRTIIEDQRQSRYRDLKERDTGK